MENVSEPHLLSGDVSELSGDHSITRFLCGCNEIMKLLLVYYPHCCTQIHSIKNY